LNRSKICEVYRTRKSWISAWPATGSNLSSAGIVIVQPVVSTGRVDVWVGGDGDVMRACRDADPAAAVVVDADVIKPECGIGRGGVVGDGRVERGAGVV